MSISKAVGHHAFRFHYSDWITVIDPTIGSGGGGVLFHRVQQQ